MIERLKRILCDIGGKDTGAAKQFDRVLKKPFAPKTFSDELVSMFQAR